MKKIIVISTIFLIITYILLPDYQFTHYHFPLDDNYMTKVEYRSVLFGK